MSEEAEAGKATRYSAASIEGYFDECGDREWNRLIETSVDEVSLHIHTHYLRKHIPAGARVLEIGAGAGRFTQVLAQLGAEVVVADVSVVQLELNKRYAQQYGFVGAVEDWQQVDICDMSRYGDGSFDRVVAYGGPLSYVLDRRDVALSECLRVLRSGGTLLLSVMSLWGSAHRHLQGVLAVPIEANRRIIETGDLLPETFPGREGNFMHMFRAGELREWLTESGVTVLDLSASGCLSVGWESTLEQIRKDAEAWNELLRIEVEASAEEGSLNMGTHLIAVVRKPGGAALPPTPHRPHSCS
jgi:2-polyprenyl-3-methyl-5-hydroxy-6-metoxy-1,4-benzoquinol methylase